MPANSDDYWSLLVRSSVVTWMTLAKFLLKQGYDRHLVEHAHHSLSISTLPIKLKAIHFQ